jgi:hypothetical protein
VISYPVPRRADVLGRLRSSHGGNPKAAAVLDEGVVDGGFFTGMLGVDKEPVFRPEFGGTDPFPTRLLSVSIRPLRR